MNTQVESRKVLFSQNDEWLILLGKDGCIRFIDWKRPVEDVKIQENLINDATSSKNGNYFAAATSNSVKIYNSKSMESIWSF